MKVNYIYRYSSYLTINIVFQVTEINQVYCIGQKSLFVMR